MPQIAGKKELFMKACVIQPPYFMDYGRSDECFEYKLAYLRQCDETMDIIVLPENSDIPCCTKTREETLASHRKYIGPLLEASAETARRCKAVVFVNALAEVAGGYRNATYAFNTKGELVGKYYKKHLPPFELYEVKLDQDYTREFSEPYVLEIDGIRYGFLTCYDFYFYEAFAAIARRNVDIIIGCSLQRSDTHSALEIMSRFCAYNCNAHLIRASVSLGADSELCGAGMIVDPRGNVLVNMKSEIGLACAEFDPKNKYYKPAGFGNPPAPHYEYMEIGRNPWQYRPGGSAIVKNDALMPYPRVCAHRGFGTAAPENSMPAFGAAVSMGAEEIEFDIWYTKDGELVSLQDPTLERVSDGTGNVYDRTYEELKELDFGIKFGEAYKGMRILRLEDILRKFSCHVIMNIHIKCVSNTEDYDRALLEKIIRLIDKYDCRKYVYLMCENDNVLRMAEELAPDIVRCVGYDGHPERMVDRAIRYHCKKIQLFAPYFDQAMIDRAHENGIRCNVFYADKPADAERYLAMGIDTVLTNDYHRISQVVKRYIEADR
jgi:glycerophosphoryl diester phosphodiesterase